ncbi:hypothetical protein [Pontibacter harenae]|uniref:hypothetical protein n=1 Tax=Pontibacter harenae TaxID=2894083 RepID=UPI001E2A2430|nr:hypothetical protein [Pontibacter harenae]MCC9167223.1 hypothetical protein [Pontibacter harenae]
MRTSLLVAALLICVSCTDTQKEAQATETASFLKQEAQTAEGQLKPGVYHIHQLSAAGFTFQYKIELLNGEYKMFDKTGSYEFDPATNVIRFTSGGIKGFNGVFTRIEHLNESRNLMIVLDFQGGIPDTLKLGEKPGGYYQYAYYQQP